MKKFICVIALFTLIGSVSLFAETYNLGNGLKLTTFFNGSYSVEDTSCGICYDVSIQRQGNDSFYVRAERWFLNEVKRYSIEKAVEYVLRQAGLAASYASNAASIIYQIFDPSPAY